MLKYSAIRQDYLRFCLAQPKIRSLKILRPERIEFRADFGAEDAVRLAPCKDDKPKDAEIMSFQAGSDYSLSANIKWSV